MDGIELLLYDLRRYQAAVARIFERKRDQKALLDHKGAPGQEVEADRQPWLAYLEMTRIAKANALPGWPRRAVRKFILL